MSTQNTSFVSRPRFDEYREQFANFFKMERRNSILQVQMHTNGGAVIYGLPLHNAWSQLWLTIGNDPDNEVLIFGGMGDKWIAGLDQEMSSRPLSDLPPDEFYDQIYSDATKLLEAFIFNIDIFPPSHASTGPACTPNSPSCAILHSARSTQSYLTRTSNSTSCPVTGRG
jgi:hypothetical protein